MTGGADSASLESETAASPGFGTNSPPGRRSPAASKRSCVVHSTCTSRRQMTVANGQRRPGGMLEQIQRQLALGRVRDPQVASQVVVRGGVGPQTFRLSGRQHAWSVPRSLTEGVSSPRSSAETVVGHVRASVPLMMTGAATRPSDISECLIMPGRSDRRSGPQAVSGRGECRDQVAHRAAHARDYSHIAYR